MAEEFKTSEAQRRAVQKYRASNIKKYAIEVHKTNEKDMYDYLESLGNKQGTIKAAIREKMERESENGKEI